MPQRPHFSDMSLKNYELHVVTGEIFAQVSLSVLKAGKKCSERTKRCNIQTNYCTLHCAWVHIGLLICNFHTLHHHQN